MQQDHQALQWAADLGKDWSLIESLLPQDWQSKARELGAFRRCGAIANARALLQVLLIHLGQGCSLRETAVQARLAGIAHLSDVALLKRLRSCSGWFEWLGQQLRQAPELRCGTSASQSPPACWQTPVRRRWQRHQRTRCHRLPVAAALRHRTARSALSASPPGLQQSRRKLQTLCRSSR